MKVLDLFSGLGGWSSAFSERRHSVVTSDIDSAFGCTITGDILDESTCDAIERHGPYDIVLASPPCEGFSVAQMGRNWERDERTGGIRGPKSARAEYGIEVLNATIGMITMLQPRWFVMENPVAAMRVVMQTMPLDWERRTVTYCQFGRHYRKPTDLWGGFPDALVLPPPCKQGAACHESAPRGSRRGVQGLKTPAERSLIPHMLSLRVCLACEWTLEREAKTEESGCLSLW